ncbi:DUF4198 domain-containing protein [Rodentibacter caecimuris]|uniref:Phosphoribosylglycinamide formyltransferase n=1 Tax=Rodentibacter caecimuris TaxID=1796644 RepID=A0ABX3KZI4_9PAST|nr:phosphoribosylglycinamide formyltransferase [Rodentibacter heylii]
MKKLVLAATLLSLAVSTQAHRVWVSSQHTHGGEILKAELGYGEFPVFEPIAESRLHIFSQPMRLFTAEGKQNLVQKGEFNYQYETEKPLKEGSYILAAEYQPTFWSKNAKGWQQQNIQQMPDATYCEQTRMYGKQVVNIGHESAATEVISRPVDHLLEIVPLDNPANIQVSDRFKVKVLYKGEPLPNVVLTATFDGFDTSDRSKSHKVEAQAFSDITADDGTVEIIPLRQGFWKASVEYKTDYPDQKICQKLANYSTLTFQVGRTYH